MDAAYNTSCTNAGYFLEKSRDMPVNVGYNLRLGGGGKLPAMGFEQMLHLWLVSLAGLRPREGVRFVGGVGGVHTSKGSQSAADISVTTET